VYFENEGNDNLTEVVRIIKKSLKRREELRTLRLVIFTATGRGPWLAYSQLSVHDVKIVAVTFPLDFSIKQNDGSPLFPRIDAKVEKLFNGVGIAIVPPAPLLFDSINGLDQHNSQMKSIKDAITIFGGGLNLCIQAVVRACDAGFVEKGERVIAMAGDCAIIVTASTTSKFLTCEEGLAVHEILCKPRNLTIARPKARKPVAEMQESFPAIEGQIPPRNKHVLPGEQK
jgi:hypothetical protein